MTSPLFLLFVFFTGLSLWLGGGVGGSATAVGLFAVAMAMLLTPKLLAAGLAIARGRADAYGGPARLLLGVVVESLVATHGLHLSLLEAGGRVLRTRRNGLRRARRQLPRGGAEAICPKLRRLLLLDPAALRSLQHTHWSAAVRIG